LAKDAKQSLEEHRQAQAKEYGYQPLYPGDRAGDGFGKRDGMTVQDLLAVLIHYHPETPLYVGTEENATRLDHLEDHYDRTGKVMRRGIRLVPR